MLVPGYGERVRAVERVAGPRCGRCYGRALWPVAVDEVARWPGGDRSRSRATLLCRSGQAGATGNEAGMHDDVVRRPLAMVVPGRTPNLLRGSGFDVASGCQELS